MKNSATFVRRITAADSNNIILLLDFNQILAVYQEFAADNIVEHTILLEDFQCKVGLFSLLEAGWPDKVTALSSESDQEAAQAKIKKEGQKVYLGVYHAYGNGPWIQKGEEILQNKNSLEQPWALMAPFFSTNETALLDEDLKIGVRVEPKAQGIGGLKGTDYLSIFGSWRKKTSICKKKDDGIEALQAQIQVLQLALAGKLTEVPANTLLGRNVGTGTVETIPQSNFAKPADVVAAIDTAISAIVAGAPGALNTLDELAAALQDDANFAATITNLLALKASISNPVFTGFTTLGDNVAIKKKMIEGTTGLAQGDQVSIPHGITTGTKIISVVGIIFYATGQAVPFNSRQAAYASVCALGITNFTITNEAGNSAGILSKAFRAVIEYIA